VRLGCVSMTVERCRERTEWPMLFVVALLGVGTVTLASLLVERASA
jgi:hypothetical protein